MKKKSNYISKCTPSYQDPDTGTVTPIFSIPAGKKGNPDAWIDSPTPAQIANFHYKNSDGTSLNQLPEGFLYRCGDLWSDTCTMNDLLEYYEKVTNCDDGTFGRSTVYVGDMFSRGYTTRLTPVGLLYYAKDVTMDIATENINNPGQMHADLDGGTERSFYAGWTWALPTSAGGTGFYSGYCGTGSGGQPINHLWGYPIAIPHPVFSTWQGNPWYISNYPNLTPALFLSDNFKQITTPGGGKQFMAGGIGSPINQLSALFPCSSIVFSGDPYLDESFMGGVGYKFPMSKIDLNAPGLNSFGCFNYKIDGHPHMDKICHMPWPSHSRNGTLIAADNGVGNYCSPGEFIPPANSNFNHYTTRNLKPVWWKITGFPFSASELPFNGKFYNQSVGCDLSRSFRPYPEYPIDPSLPFVILRIGTFLPACAALPGSLRFCSILSLFFFFSASFNRNSYAASAML